MLRLLFRHAPTGHLASTSPLPSSASIAGLAPPLRALVLSSAASASLCPPSALRSASALSSSLMQSARVSPLIAPIAAHRAHRSFHCSNQTRAKAGSDSSDAAVKGRQATRPEQSTQTNSEHRGQPSKDNQQRKARPSNGSNDPRKGAHQTAANNTAAPAASQTERAAIRVASTQSASTCGVPPSAPVATLNRGRSSDRTAQQRGRNTISPHDHATRVAREQPFRFDSQSGQSLELQSTLHQLKTLSFEYQDKFPAKHSSIAGSMDITQKSEWQSMRGRATQVRALRTTRDTLSTRGMHERVTHFLLLALACLQLLDSLLQQSSSAASVDGRLTLAQCERMLFACKDFRLVQEPLLVLCAMMDCDTRIPAKCAAMLLECVVKSVQWSAANSEPAPRGDHLALSALHGGRAPPSADLCGVELALWMLASMLSPTFRGRFDVDGSSWTNVLQGLIHAAPKDRGNPTRLQRARAFYGRIPDKDEFTHTTMLTAYSRAGLHSEQDALMQLMQADPIAGASPGVTTAHLAQIHHELNTPQRQADQAANRSSTLTAKEGALVQEVARLWSAAMERPAERMDVVVTGGTLKVWALLGDIPRMLTIIAEAIEAEQAQSLVLVDPACYGQLFDSLSESADPARWKAEANDAWEQMQRRHADAQKRNFLERANVLRSDEATLNAYMRYLQLTQQRAELDRLWLTTPRHLKEANETIFLARLKVLAADGDAAAAERIIGEMASFNVQPNDQHFAAWLGCCKKGGRCADAERVWQRMINRGVKSASYCYRNLMLVYMHDGSPAQVAKIDRLYAEMQRACPEGMSAGDYQQLIKTAHLCRLPSEARKWSERAKAAGRWKDLDAASHTIVATIAQWQALPRDLKSN